VVAQLDGPTSYTIGPPVILSDVTVGDEGSIDLEFKADAITGCLWYMGDVFGGSVGEYRLLLDNNNFHAFLWNSGTYSVNWSTPFTDTADWHSVRMAWKEGEDTLITLDGVTTNVANAGTLNDFTSGEGLHALGDYPSETYHNPYVGELRNVKVYDTYEQSASIVAQHDGPTTIGPTVQTLPDVTIGDEGTVEMEFMAEDLTGCIWYMGDVPGGSLGEYRLELVGDALRGVLWNNGTYSVDFSVPFEDTTEWHSVKMTWKEGEETLITLDGVTTSATNSTPLVDFASGPGYHVTGGYPEGWVGGNYFTGMTRNVKVYDTYDPTSALLGDLNADGFVGGDDLDIVRSFWGQNVEAGNLLQGDPSGDGFVGGDDLDIVRGNWGGGTPPAPGAVPEPAALLLLVGGLLAAILRRPSRQS